MHPPTHLHYFSPKTIKLLLEKNGFEIVYNQHCGFYRSLENMLYNILVLRLKWSRLHAWLGKTGIFRLALYLNLFDIMYVIARKK